MREDQPAPTAAQRRLRWLALILAVYVALSSLYAVLTPPWQAPDEPAHFNYVHQLAATGRLPVLQPGDYDQAYLEEIKARRFPAGMSIEGIRYEGHQPPLYYTLAVPIFRLSAGWEWPGQLWALRLFGVALGAGVVLLVWAATWRLFGERHLLALTAAGFVAVLPMHVAMMASVNNDPLAELLIAAGMLRLLGHLRQRLTTTRSWAVTGVIVGLGLLAKFQAYILLPLTAAVWLWRRWRQSPHPTARFQPFAGWRSGLAWGLPALLLPLPWWLRNMAIYGLSDPLGLQRHDAIVAGQPRTAEWIAAYGLDAYLERLLTFTFQSFWGVFGWLGVFMDGHVYLLLAALSGLALVGLAWELKSSAYCVVRRRSGVTSGLALLALQFALVAASYVWYNLSFVQHQGRYFFPALLPISVGFALGLQGLSSPGGSRWAALAAFAGAGLLAITGLLRGDLPGWALLVLAGSGVALAIHSRWPRIPAAAWSAAALLLLALITLHALFAAILPHLSR